MLDPVEFGKAMASIVREAQAPLLKRIEDLEAKRSIEPDFPQLVSDAVSAHLKAYPPKDGNDGSSVTLDDVTPFVAEAIKAAVEALPKPKDGDKGKDADPVDMASVSELIALAIECHFTKHPIPVPKDGEPGKDGNHGKDAEPVEAAAVVAELLAGDEIKTIVDLQVAESVQKHFEANPIRHGKDGESIKGEKGDKGDTVKGDPGENGVGLAGAMIDRDGDLVVTTTKGDAIKLGKVVGHNGERGKDGADFSEASIDYDGERGLIIRGKGGEIVRKMPIPIDKGYWRAGMACEKGDIVTESGNAWIAVKDTTAKPSTTNTEDWRLFARKGRDGEDGKNGRNLGPAEPVKLSQNNA